MSQQPNTNMQNNYAIGANIQQTGYIYHATTYAQPQYLNTVSEYTGFALTDSTNNITHGPFAFIPPAYPTYHMHSNMNDY